MLFSFHALSFNFYLANNPPINLHNINIDYPTHLGYNIIDKK